MIMSRAYLKWEFAFLSHQIQCSSPVLFRLIPIVLLLVRFSPPSSFSLLFLSSFPLLPHFPHSLLSISCLLLLPPGQPFLIMTFLLQRSWDTLRQHWERISAEFNLDLCFTPRLWNSSLFYRSVKYCPIPWSDRREVWQDVLSVCQSLFTNTFLPFVISVDFVLAYDVEINRGPDGWSWLHSVRLRGCQWQGHWFNNEVLPIAFIRGALSLLSALSVNCGLWVKFAM